MDRHDDVGMLLEQQADRFGQAMRGEIRHRAHMEISGRRQADRARRLADPVGAREVPLHFPVQAQRRLGRDDLDALPLEQSQLQFVFQVADQARDRRL